MAFAIGVNAQDHIDGTFNVGNTNVTDATIILPADARGDWTRITDLTASSDGANVGKLLICEGYTKFLQNVTNAGGTKISVSGTIASNVNLTNGFAILLTGSSAGFGGLGYEAIRMTNINSTNIFLETAPTSNQVVNQVVWITRAPVERWSVPNLTLTNSVLVSPTVNLYLPGGDLMSVLRVTNSASVNTKLSVSGYRFSR